ncbi:MAG: hypothetical protein WCG44_00870 [bacterium]
MAEICTYRIDPRDTAATLGSNVEIAELDPKDIKYLSSIVNLLAHLSPKPLCRIKQKATDLPNNHRCNFPDLSNTNCPLALYTHGLISFEEANNRVLKLRNK